MINVPAPDPETVRHLLDVVFPAILLELGPPPKRPMRQRQMYSPSPYKPKGLGALQLRESTRVGCKGPRPVPPNIVPAPYGQSDTASFWEYRNDVRGLLQYRYNIPEPTIRSDSYLEWCIAQENLHASSQ